MPYTIALVGMTPNSKEEYATSLLRWIERHKNEIGDLEDRLFGSGGIKHDYVDLNLGRDFLKESKTYDMVILGNIWHPDPGEAHLQSGIFAVSPKHSIGAWKRRLVGTKAEIIGIFGLDLGGDQIGDLPGYTRYRENYMTSVYVRNTMKRSAVTLREKLIRLAHANPDLRPDLLPLLQKKASVGRENARRMLTNGYSQKKSLSAMALIDKWFASKCRDGITGDILTAIAAEEDHIRRGRLPYEPFTNKDLFDVIFAHIKHQYRVTDAFAKGIATQIAFGNTY